MQLAGMVVSAGLGIVVIAEGAYIVRTRAQLAGLAQKIDAIGAAEDPLRDPPRFAGRGAGEVDSDRDDELAPAARRALGRLPHFTSEPAGAAAPDSSGDPLPLPAALSSAAAREQLRQFVVAQLARERQEDKAKADERRQVRLLDWSGRAAKQIGLSDAETQAFNDLTAKNDAARTKLRDQIATGELDRAQIRQQSTALRTDADQQMRALLGDDRMQKLQDFRREEGGPPGEGPGGGRFGGGGAGQGRQQAGGGPQAGAPRAGAGVSQGDVTPRGP